MEIITLLGLSLLIQYLLFIPAFFFQTDKLTDLSYAITFILLAALAFQGRNLGHILILTAVIIWAVRLGGFLFIRIRKMKQDKRFDTMRKSFFRFASFWTIQGVTVWVVSLAALLFFNNTPYLGPLFIIGLAIWAAGLIIEATADYQKYLFKQKKSGAWIDEGLWHYSRHPNYFGEMLCWVGIYLAVVPSLPGAQKIYALASPAFIIFMLLFVSGIPLLEKEADKRWGKNKEYKRYKESTSALIPWFKS